MWTRPRALTATSSAGNTSTSPSMTAPAYPQPQAADRPVPPSPRVRKRPRTVVRSLLDCRRPRRLGHAPASARRAIRSRTGGRPKLILVLPGPSGGSTERHPHDPRRMQRIYERTRVPTGATDGRKIAQYSLAVVLERQVRARDVEASCAGGPDGLSLSWVATNSRVLPERDPSQRRSVAEPYVVLDALVLRHPVVLSQGGHVEACCSKQCGKAYTAQASVDEEPWEPRGMTATRRASGRHGVHPRARPH